MIVDSSRHQGGVWLLLGIRVKAPGIGRFCHCGSLRKGQGEWEFLLLLGSASSTTVDVLVVVGNLEVVDSSCLQFQATLDPCQRYHLNSLR
jgi:hypothetical protein